MILLRWLWGLFWDHVTDRARDDELAALRAENEQLREENRQLLAVIIEIEGCRGG